MTAIFFASQFLFISNVAFALNLGVRGSVYQIMEPDMLMGIQEKLRVMQQSGELDRENKAVLSRTVQHILRPMPVSGVTDLSRGETPATHYFNPTIVLNKDIKDSSGNKIAEKGTKVNPLNTIHFDETLAFINGDNSQQIKWVMKLIRQYQDQNRKFKIILVNGNIKDVSTQLNARVYFDQYGKLCQHFKIIHTPTLVFEPENQKGNDKQLVVKEVQID